ncbi:hypothetical protein HA402_005237 [Bradysia odoriphaga]|nr:hypothetical protein HA402_005237 [Bradysia odoriphaga]
MQAKKVPTSTNSLVALMNMVEQWRAKTDYGPVCVVSPWNTNTVTIWCYIMSYII